MQQRPVFHIGFLNCASTLLQQQVFPDVKTYAFFTARAEIDAIAE